jgi:hypothetical protein
MEMMELNMEELCFSEFSITPELLFLDGDSQGIAGRTAKLKLSQTEYINTTNANHAERHQLCRLHDHAVQHAQAQQ